MATNSEVPRDFNEYLTWLNRRVITLERRRPGDGVNIDGQCEFGGGAGGDGGYYGGGTDYPDPTYPDSTYPPYFDDWLNDYINDNPDWFQDWANDNPDWLNDFLNDNPNWLDDYLSDNPGAVGGALTAGANIAIESPATIHFEVVFTEPVSPRIGQLWFDDTA